MPCPCNGGPRLYYQATCLPFSSRFRSTFAGHPQRFSRSAPSLPDHSAYYSVITFIDLFTLFNDWSGRQDLNRDIMVPNHALYQTELRPEHEFTLASRASNTQSLFNHWKRPGKSRTMGHVILGFVDLSECQSQFRHEKTGS